MNESKEPKTTEEQIRELEEEVQLLHQRACNAADNHWRLRQRLKVCVGLAAVAAIMILDL